MSYIIKVEDSGGKYYVTHTRFPGLKASGDTLYSALEAFDKVSSDEKITKTTEKTERRLIQKEIVI